VDKRRIAENARQIDSWTNDRASLWYILQPGEERMELLDFGAAQQSKISRLVIVFGVDNQRLWRRFRRFLRRKPGLATRSSGLCGELRRVS
jgi:hypothetical protein